MIAITWFYYECITNLLFLSYLRMKLPFISVVTGSTLICMYILISLSNSLKSAFHDEKTTEKSNMKQSMDVKSHEMKLIKTGSKQFAFTSCSIHSIIEAYCFYTPIVTLAWRRLGFEVIIILVGDFNSFHNKTKPEEIQLITKYIHQFGGRTYEFQSPRHYAMKISQLVRVFIGFLPLDFSNDNDYYIITDADLIPLNREQYLLQKSYPDGFIVNRFCCESFNRRNQSYQMIPMSYVYMKKYLWVEIILQSSIHKELVYMTQNFDLYLNKSYEIGLLQTSTKEYLTSLLLNKGKMISFDIISLYLRHEYQQIYDKSTIKGSIGWSMDQELLTMLIVDYQNLTRKGQTLKIDQRGIYVRREKISIKLIFIFILIRNVLIEQNHLQSGRKT